jgi:23S rRNA (adenine1618-N6)-methyltransferase
LHPRNRNRDRYDVAALVTCLPDLAAFVKKSKSGNDTIDFAKPEAVKLLNRALIMHYYGLKAWDFPDKNLCPPVPGRADYIHFIADVLRENHFGAIPKGSQVKCLDVGVGASAIYPIVGIVEYGWSFIGSDVSEESLTAAEAIQADNPLLKNNLDLRLQAEGQRVFHGILKPTDFVDAVLCNPPFHASAEDALQGSLRKTRNLSGGKQKSPMLNFSGVSKELIFEGGEVKFIQTMMRESRNFSKNVFWFSSLVSKQSHLKSLYQELKTIKPVEIKTIPMGTGNKSTRILAWTFLSKEERKEWRERNVAMALKG